MATPRARDILKVPGRLVKNPTNLAAAYPYGGTELGLTKNRSFRLRATHREIQAEEHGMATVEVIRSGDSPVFACTLRAYDDDALSAIFWITATGDPSGHKVVKSNVTGTGRAGARLSQSSMVLLHVPLAPLRHPSMLIYAAMPAIAEEASIQWSAKEELGIDVVFYCRPDTSDRLCAIGRLGDLSL